MSLKDDYIKIISRTGKTGELETYLHLNEELNIKLNHIINASGQDLKFDCYIGHYPLNSVNARTFKQNNGFLILLHEGAGEFTAGISRLIAARIPAMSQGNILKPLIDDSEAKRLFQLFSNIYLKGERAMRYEIREKEVEKIRNLYPARENYCNHLFESTIYFFIAHELSHIMLGHVPSNTSSLEAIYARPSDIDVNSYKNELEADLLAGKLILLSYKEKGISNEMILEGSVMFFDALEATWWKLTNRMRSYTHPSPEERRSAMLVDIFPNSFLSQVPKLDFLVREISKLKGGNPLSIEAGIRTKNNKEINLYLSKIFDIAQRGKPQEFEKVMGYTDHGFSVTNSVEIKRYLSRNFEIR